MNKTEDLAYTNHKKEVARIKNKYTTEMNDKEASLFNLWLTSESNQSLKVIKGWVTFFGVLQIIAIILAVIFYFNN
jgi:hypothetical protein